MRILFAVLLLATFAVASDDDEPIDVGTPIVVGEAMPHMRLPTIDGDRFDTRALTNERRRTLLIEFASW